MISLPLTPDIEEPRYLYLCKFKTSENCWCYPVAVAILHKIKVTWTLWGRINTFEHRSLSKQDLITPYHRSVDYLLFFFDSAFFEILNLNFIFFFRFHRLNLEKIFMFVLFLFIFLSTFIRIQEFWIKKSTIIKFFKFLKCFIGVFEVFTWVLKVLWVWVVLWRRRDGHI